MDRQAAEQAGRRQRALGHRAYSPLLLRGYDRLVLGLSSRRVWRCPPERLVGLYDRFVGASHLDVGPGTGYLLDHCSFPVAQPRLGLLDVNPSSLAHAARRLARYRPALYRADVLLPLALETPPFESIGLSYVLHCLPGSIAEKGPVLDHLAPLLAPGGTVFGATILGPGTRHSAAARGLLAVYNAAGAFSNRADSLAGLRSILERRFGEAEIEVVGSVALFSARRAR